MKRKVVLLMGLCVCLVSLVGVYNFLDLGTETSTAQTIVPESIDEDTTREVNGVNITLNGARIEESTQVDSHFVIIDLEFANHRETVYEFSTFKLTLVDEDNFAHGVTTQVETKGILGGQLHPGRTNRGEVAFLVPKAKEYELVYTDHLRTGQVTWQVHVNEDE
ncbi:DUF4352 domain-containing protein [Halalkalibacter okhensis]|uniref:DUF4352 domain-containing protein n=1 Tax=Halalkalibacter okhensis TaxID=333138 RepID=A0A0B0ID34_9BACI|nr:DUF4352 domain-containing protein [Halalkalibacter okhensis]KHF40478.1 hypothetical protein LQ50_09430 [Halalkalibacter okhensis]